VDIPGGAITGYVAWFLGAGLILWMNTSNVKKLNESVPSISARGATV
jgi:hypothetical protein